MGSCFVSDIYKIPTNKSGRQSLQISFATKLLHMVNPTTPIYDSMVAAFYFFDEPGRKQPLQLLSPAIQSFRRRFSPQHFTDEKVIDSLLWAFVSLLRNGAVVQGTVVYR